MQYYLLESVWGKQLWMLPLLTIAGALIFLLKAYKASKSGSKVGQGNQTVYSDKNIPIYKIPFFWYGAVLIVATLVIIISVNGSK